MEHRQVFLFHITVFQWAIQVGRTELFHTSSYGILRLFILLLCHSLGHGPHLMDWDWIAGMSTFHFLNSSLWVTFHWQDLTHLDTHSRETGKCSLRLGIRVSSGSLHCRESESVRESPHCVCLDEFQPVLHSIFTMIFLSPEALATSDPASL